MRESAAALRPAATTRLAWMDELRGVGILMVIAFHGETVMSRFAPSTPTLVSLVDSFFAPFRMPLLMFLSGMLLTRSLSKPAARYISGKLRGIAWPYVLWSVVFLAVAEQLSAGTLVGVVLVPPTYLWYLWFLLAYYAMVWLATRWRVPPVALTTGAVIGSFGPEALRISRFFFLLIFFLLGHLFYTHRERIRLESWAFMLIPAACAVALSAGLLSAAGWELQYRPAFMLAPLSGIVLAVMLMPRGRGGPLRRALGYIGRNAIVYYVTHFTVIWVTGWWLRETDVLGPWGRYGAGVAMALGAGTMLTWARHRSRLVDAMFAAPMALAVSRPATRGRPLSARGTTPR